MKNVHLCEQGTPEWFALRCGIVTASEMDSVMAKGKGNAESKTRRTYMLKLIGERLTGDVAESFTNAHMERGKVMEAEARDMYSLVTNATVEQAGFIRNGEVGYSPDGLPPGGLLEIKTKLPHLHLDCLLRDEVPPEHKAQVQCGLWVAESEWLDFVSYWPKLPLFIKRVYRDEAFIKAMAAEVARFYEEMNALVAKIDKQALAA